MSNYKAGKFRLVGQTSLLIKYIRIYCNIAHSVHCEFIYKLFQYQQMNCSTIPYFNPNWILHVKPKQVEANYE